MNTKVLAIAVAAIMVMAAVGVYLLVSNKGGDDSGLSPDMFKDYRAEFGDSVSLGIVNDTSLNTQSSVSGNGGSNTLGSSSLGEQEDKKNRLVGIDDNDNMSEVWFSKITMSDDGRPNVITQDDFKAQVDKLHITRDLIYFTLTVRAICSDCNKSYSGNYQHYCYTDPMNSFYSRDHYDRSGYESDKETQSFVIDRQNKYVYSLAEIPHIYYLDENLITGKTIVGYSDGGYPIFSDLSVYLLTTEEGQIKFTDMVPNKNIYVKRGMMDKDGTVFIVNNTMDTIANGVVMIRPHDYWASNDGFNKGSDGKVYNTGELKVFSTELMDWVAADTSERVLIWEGHVYTIIKNEKIYTITSSPSNYKSYSVRDNAGGLFFDHPQYVFFLDENAICLNDGSLYAYITANATTDCVKIPIAENIQRMEFKGNKVIAYKPKSSDVGNVPIGRDGDAECCIKFPVGL